MNSKFDSIIRDRKPRQPSRFPKQKLFDEEHVVGNDMNTMLSQARKKPQQSNRSLKK